MWGWEQMPCIIDQLYKIIIYIDFFRKEPEKLFFVYIYVKKNDYMFVSFKLVFSSFKVNTLYALPFLF